MKRATISILAIIGTFMVLMACASVPKKAVSVEPGYKVVAYHEYQFQVPVDVPDFGTWDVLKMGDIAVYTDSKLGQIVGFHVWLDDPDSADVVILFFKHEQSLEGFRLFGIIYKRGTITYTAADYDGDGKFEHKKLLDAIEARAWSGPIS